MSEGLSIQFGGEVDAATRDQWARELSEELKDSFDARRLKPNTDSMDFGATITLTIGTAGVVAFCRMVQSFVERNRAKITVTGANGQKVEISAGSGAEASQLVKDITPLVEAQK